MAVIKCADCKGKVSDQAGACPHCGAPVRAPAAAAPPKKKGRLRYYAEFVGAGLLAFPVVGFVVHKIGSIESSEPRVEGPYVMVLNGETPIAWAGSAAICERERRLEFYSPAIACVPEARAPEVPPRGVEIVRSSAREGSTAWQSSRYVRYAPGVYSPARCTARAALLTAKGMEGSLGVVSTYSCQAATA